jgi:hypothetical protein
MAQLFLSCASGIILPVVCPSFWCIQSNSADIGASGAFSDHGAIASFQTHLTRPNW